MRQADPSVLLQPARLAAVRRIAGEGGRVRDAVEAMLRATAGLLGVPTVSVALVDHERELVWVTSTPETMPCWTHPARRSLCAVVVGSGQELTVADVTADARLAASGVDVDGILHGRGIASYLGAPLVVDGGLCVGSVCAYGRGVQAWTDAERNALGWVARSVALLLAPGPAAAEPGGAVESARLVAEHAALRRVATVAAFGEPGHLVLEVAAEELEALLGVPVAVCRAPDGEAAELVLGSAGAGAGELERLCRAWHAGAGDVLAVPIGAGGTVWGAIVVPAADAPAPALVQAFADLAAVALDNERHRRRLAEEATTDPLSGLANRRALDTELRHRYAAHRRTDAPFAVALLDIDRFKTVNDLQGHRAGDDVLRAVATCLLASTREHELVARLGGDEFCVVFDGDAAHAAAVADRLRAAIEEHTPVTVSAGVCAATQAPDADALLESADRALYAAKAAGRNTVRLNDG